MRSAQACAPKPFQYGRLALNTGVGRADRMFYYVEGIGPRRGWFRLVA